MKRKLFLFVALFSIAFLSNAQYAIQDVIWNQESVGVSDISVVDENIVWITGYDADGVDPVVDIMQIAKTVDGGTTWVVSDYSLSGAATISNLHALSADRAFCMAYDDGTFTPSFWETNDGGASWSQVDLLFGGASSFANGVSFWDDKVHGFCHGDYDADTDEYEIYYTDDAGVSWYPVESVPTVQETDEYSFNGNDQMTYVGSTAYIITNYGRVLKTSDYGVNWALTGTDPYSGATKYDGVQIFAASEDIIICRAGTTTGDTYAWEDHYMRSDDGGDSWTVLAPTGPMHKSGICRIPGEVSTFISTGANANEGSVDLGVSRSTDGGLTWVAEPNWLTTTEGGDAQALIPDFASNDVGFIGQFDAVVRYDKPASVNTINMTNFNVYPNPSTGILNLNLSKYNNANITVVDMVGKVIKTYNNANSNTVIDLTKNSKGLYFININSGEINETVKVVIK